MRGVPVRGPSDMVLSDSRFLCRDSHEPCEDVPRRAALLGLEPEKPRCHLHAQYGTQRWIISTREIAEGNGTASVKTHLFL